MAAQVEFHYSLQVVVVNWLLVTNTYYFRKGIAQHPRCLIKSGHYSDRKQRYLQDELGINNNHNIPIQQTILVA